MHKQKTLEFELNDKIESFEKKSGIFSSNVGKEIHSEIGRLKDLLSLKDDDLIELK